MIINSLIVTVQHIKYQQHKILYVSNDTSRVFKNVVKRVKINIIWSPLATLS